MNKFLKQHGANGQKIILNEMLDTFMEKRGFERDTSAYGDETIGWSTSFYDKENFYYYRIHITSQLIQVHEEYDSGGLSREWEYNVEEENLEDIDAFVALMSDVYKPLNI